MLNTRIWQRSASHWGILQCKVSLGPDIWRKKYCLTQLSPSFVAQGTSGVVFHVLHWSVIMQKLAARQLFWPCGSEERREAATTLKTECRAEKVKSGVLFGRAIVERLFAWVDFFYFSFACFKHTAFFSLRTGNTRRVTFEPQHSLSTACYLWTSGCMKYGLGCAFRLPLITRLRILLWLAGRHCEASSLLSCNFLYHGLTMILTLRGIQSLFPQTL